MGATGNYLTESCCLMIVLGLILTLFLCIEEAAGGGFSCDRCRFMLKVKGEKVRNGLRHRPFHPL